MRVRFFLVNQLKESYFNSYSSPHYHPGIDRSRESLLQVPLLLSPRSCFNTVCFCNLSISSLIVARDSSSPTGWPLQRYFKYVSSPSSVLLRPHVLNMHEIPRAAYLVFNCHRQPLFSRSTRRDFSFTILSEECSNKSRAEEQKKVSYGEEESAHESCNRKRRRIAVVTLKN